MKSHIAPPCLGAIAVLAILLAAGPAGPNTVYAVPETTTVPIPVICCGTPGTQSSPQLAFSTNVATQGPLLIEYLVTRSGTHEHCSSIRLHISVDGEETFTTGFLGYVGDPLGRPMTTGPVDLAAVPQGVHTITLLPEGTLGGCNEGTLARWTGTLLVTSEPPPTGGVFQLPVDGISPPARTSGSPALPYAALALAGTAAATGLGACAWCARRRRPTRYRPE
jgi:hypothetical protein